MANGQGHGDKREVPAPCHREGDHACERVPVNLGQQIVTECYLAHRIGRVGPTAPVGAIVSMPSATKVHIVISMRNALMNRSYQGICGATRLATSVVAAWLRINLSSPLREPALAPPSSVWRAHKSGH
jgi:hypothetical protein